MEVVAMADKAGRRRSASFGKKRILVVEDHKGVRDIVAGMLTSAGYKCRAVSSGTKALELLETGNRFELMICDLRNKPHGIILLERTKERFPKMPVVVMTGRCCACTAQFAVSEMGASAALIKPFAREELFVTLYRVLEGRRINFPNSVGVA
jgi:DNA-binding NtrC family response regulator